MHLLDHPRQKTIKPSYSVFGIIVMVALLLLGLHGLWLPDHALAASYTWDGGGADNNWSTCANWSTNVCPIAGDILTFNSTSTKSSTIDAGWAAGSIATLNINSGYTGTITMARSLTVTTTYSQAAGTFTAAGQSLNTVALTLSAGNFTASSGTTTVTGALTISGSPTFSANGGTFAFNGGTASLACNNVAFNLVTFGNSGAKTVGSACSMPLGSNPTASTGLTVNGTLSGSGTFTVSSATLTIGTTGSLSGFTGLSASGLTVNGTFNASSYTTFTLSSALGIGAAGTFTAPATMSTTSFNFTAGATFNANGGTVTITGNSGTLNCANATFNLIVINNTATKTISSDCSLPLGSNPAIANSIALNGTLTGTGTFTQSSGLLTLNSGYAMTGFSGLSTTALAVSNATANFGSYTTFAVNGTFALLGTANFTAPSATMSVSSTFAINSTTTFNANNGTVVFNGSSGAVTITCNNTSFYLVQFTHTGSASKNVGSDCTLPLGNNPTIGGDATADFSNSGTLTGTGTITIGTAASGNTLGLNPSSVFTGFSGLRAGTLTTSGLVADFSSYSTFEINGAYSQGGGGTTTVPNGADFNSSFTLVSAAATTFNAPSGNLYIGGSFTINSGNTFNHNNGTIHFDPASTVSLLCNNTAFHLVTLEGSSTLAISIGSDCTLPLGNNPTASRFTLNGTLTGTGTLTLSTFGTTSFVNSSATLSGFSGLVASNGAVSFTATNFDFSSYSPFSILGSFTLSSGAVFTAPTAGMSVGRVFTINSGTTFNDSGGTLTFNGGLPSVTDNLACNNTIFTKVVFAHTAGAKRVGSTCSLPLGNNPTSSGGTNADINLTGGTLTGTGTLSVLGYVNGTTGSDLTLETGAVLSGFSGLVVDGQLVVQGATSDFSHYTAFTIGKLNMVSGTLTAPTGTMNVSGDFSVTGGTFDANGGSVVLTGANQAIVGNNNFYNLTKQVTTASTLTLPASGIQTVTNTLVLKGQPLQLLSLVSSTPGSNWIINLLGTASVCSVDVTDSDSTGRDILAYSSFSNSTNAGWTFNDEVCGGNSGGSAAVIEPTTAVTNFQLSQAAAVTSENQVRLVKGATDQRLLSPVSSIFSKVPTGPAVIRSIIGFFAVCLAGIIAGGLGFWWLLASHKRNAGKYWLTQNNIRDETW